MTALAPSLPPAGVLDQFVQRARELYTLPQAAVRVLELTNQPKIDVRALKECIELDPALTGKILRVVNSSLFGLSREVSDLNQALALLGIAPLKMLVLGFSLPKNLFTALEAEVLSHYWRHTLTKAVVGRELATRCFHRPGDEAFIAGLLQGIGQLVLIQDLGEPYIHFVKRVTEQGGELGALEMQTLGFDHAILSARLLNHWGLPPEIVRAVGQPLECESILALPPAQQPLPMILHLAELIARLLATDAPHVVEALFDAGRRYRKLTLDELPDLLADLDDKVQQLASVLQLHLTEGVEYRDVLLGAHTQLSAVAEDGAKALLDASAQWGETQALAQAAQAWSAAPAPAPVAPTAAKASAAWTDPGLEGRIAAAMAACRQTRRPLSLILVEADRHTDMLMTLGAAATAALLAEVRDVIAQALDAPLRLVPQGDAQFAVILEAHDRALAVELGRELLRVARRAFPPTSDDAPGLSLSAGVASLAIPPKNFPPGELVAAARRCLQGAQLSGGDTLKSIELV